MSAATDKQKQTQASEYVLGVLPEEERAAFERALGHDPELRRLVAEFTDTLGESARSLPAVAPSADLKDRVLRRISQPDHAPDAPQPEKKIIPFSVWLPWAAAAGIAVGTVFLLVERNSLLSEKARLVAEVDGARNKLETLQDTADALRNELSAARRAANVAALRIARLESQQTAQPGALAVSLWNSVTQEGVLVVENLSLPPPGKTYQLWVLDPSTQAPIDAGIFTTDSQGRGRIIFRPRTSVKSAAQFAVSLEAAGGSTTPKGPIVMIGPATDL